MRTRFVLLLALALTCAASVYDESIAYFPIEISLMATGPWSHQMFVAGMCLVVVHFYWTLPRQERHKQVPLVGLVILTVFNDHSNWLLHMVGILVMILGVVAVAVLDRKFWPLGFGLVVYVIRLALKLWAIVRFELTEQQFFSVLILFPFLQPPAVGLKFFELVAEKCRLIMLTGDTAHWVTLAVFQICGLLQWLAFAIWWTWIIEPREVGFWRPYPAIVA